MAKNKKQDLVGYKFIHKTYGVLTVKREGKPYDGTCDIRVAWDCEDKDGKIINLPARYIKRYERVKE